MDNQILKGWKQTSNKYVKMQNPDLHSASSYSSETNQHCTANGISWSVTIRKQFWKLKSPFSYRKFWKQLDSFLIFCQNKFIIRGFLWLLVWKREIIDLNNTVNPNTAADKVFSSVKDTKMNCLRTQINQIITQ